jgi:hypothetical protein
MRGSLSAAPAYYPFIRRGGGNAGEITIIEVKYDKD